MGCKQSTTNEKSLVIETRPPGPTYVKGVLKKPPQASKGRTEILSARKNPGTLRKSVNFDEKVRVKSRTPTPRGLAYEKSQQTTKRVPVTTPPTDSGDDDSEVASVSSDEESPDEGSLATTVQVNVTLQRNQPIGFRSKVNQAGPITRIESPIEKPPTTPNQVLPPIPVTRLVNQPETPPSQTGKRLRILRKTADTNPSPNSETTSGPITTNTRIESNATLNPTSSLHPNKAPIVIAHRVDVDKNVPMKADANQSTGTYYAFSRRSKTKSN